MFGLDLKKALGYGVGIYVVMFMYWSLLMAFGQAEAAWGFYGAFVVLAVVARLAGARMGVSDVASLLKYAVVFVVAMVVLDVIVTTRFTGYEFFSMWETYVAYAILLLAPVSVAFYPKAKTMPMDTMPSSSEFPGDTGNSQM